MKETSFYDFSLHLKTSSPKEAKRGLAYSEMPCWTFSVRCDARSGGSCKVTSRAGANPVEALALIGIWPRYCDPKAHLWMDRNVC